MSEGYSEKLWPAWWIWLIAVLLGIGLGTTVLRYTAVGAVVTTVICTAIMVGLLVLSTPEVAVRDGQLIAGRARVPLALIGPAETLDAAALRHAIGPGLDARAYLCIRGWLPHGVRVALTDPQDPTPFWVVSSRHPDALAQALERSRDHA